MHAIELRNPDLGQFARTSRPDEATPGRGRVLVRMKAASLNFIDIAVASGQYPGVVYPVIPLVDGAGEVIGTGPDVWQVRTGDRVMINPKPRWIAGDGSLAISGPTRGLNLPGALVEIAEVDAASVVRVPDHLTWEEAATIPGAGAAAWRALRNVSIGPAATVVLLGTGGVSIFALQLARAHGARVIVTSSSDQKLERARAMGADETINYRTRPAWDEVVRDLTGGLGADLVIDSAGGATFDRSLRALRYGGTVFALGFVGGVTAALDLVTLNANGLRIEGTNGTSVADLAGAAGDLAAHRLRPVIDRGFGLAELEDAYRYVQGGSHFGKVALTLDW